MKFSYVMAVPLVITTANWMGAPPMARLGAVGKPVMLTVSRPLRGFDDVDAALAAGVVGDVVVGSAVVAEDVIDDEVVA